MMKSPGIPHKTEIVKKISEQGIQIISEMELAYRHKGDSKIIGITGSNGKTTTTSLIYQICKKGGMDCAPVGNIGNSIARQIAIDPKPLYVVEISSFQLDDIISFRPDVAVLTNITEDHLDRYDYDFNKYIRSKFNITKNQTALDFFIYNADDPVTAAQLTHYPIHAKPLPISMQREMPKGAHIKEGKMTVTHGDSFSMSIFDFALKGKHNQYNSMAAAVAGSVIGIRKEKIRDAVASFESLEHRMEMVATVRGIDFINDSKATNAHAAAASLLSNFNVIWIAGGLAKGANMDSLLAKCIDRIKIAILIGTDRGSIETAINKYSKSIKIEKIDKKTDSISFMNEIVKYAKSVAQPGDTVLLAPACASMDQFRSYAERGELFAAAVKRYA